MHEEEEDDTTTTHKTLNMNSFKDSLELLESVKQNDDAKAMGLVKRGAWNLDALNIAKLQNRSIYQMILNNHPAKLLEK